MDLLEIWINYFNASQRQNVPTNSASCELPKTTFSHQFPEPPSAQLLVSSALEQTSSCLLDDRPALWLVCARANRCPLHLLSDNRICSVGWSSVGWRLISDMQLSYGECVRFTFTESASNAIISVKSFLEPFDVATPGKNFHLTEYFYLYFSKKQYFLKTPGLL